MRRYFGFAAEVIQRNMLSITLCAKNKSYAACRAATAELTMTMTVPENPRKYDVYMAKNQIFIFLSFWKEASLKINVHKMSYGINLVPIKIEMITFRCCVRQMLEFHHLI